MKDTYPPYPTIPAGCLVPAARQPEYLPLPGRDLVRIFERVIDVMRNIQKSGAEVAEPAKAETELDSEVND